MSTYDWIAGEWGASGLRLWCMSGGTLVDTRHSVVGLGDLGAGDHLPVLRSLVPDLPAGQVPVVLCGALSGPGGWQDLACHAIPTKLPLTPVAVATEADLAISLVPGLRQGAPADVMRGGETRVAGFLALNPQFDGVVLLPGAVTTWVHVSAGEVVSFRSFMTGEMAQSLASGPSLLGRIAPSGLDADAFSVALSEGMSHPARVASELFSLAADPDMGPDAARGRLLGLLVGQELSAARPYWLGQMVGLLDGDPLAPAYAEALSAQGVPLMRADGARMTLEGLKAARK